MKKTVMMFVALALIFGAGSVHAGGFSWLNHASPFDFLFGNQIDAHQQSMVLGNAELQGFLYITFTGKLVSGYPEAVHTDCSQMPGACTAGWVLHGIPMKATLSPNSTMDRQTWCVPASSLPAEPGYSHFHWTGAPNMCMDLVPGKQYDGYLLKLTSIDTFYFDMCGNTAIVTPGIDSYSHLNITTNCN